MNAIGAQYPHNETRRIGADRRSDEDRSLARKCWLTAAAATVVAGGSLAIARRALGDVLVPIAGLGLVAAVAYAGLGAFAIRDTRPKGQIYAEDVRTGAELLRIARAGNAPSELQVAREGNTYTLYRDQDPDSHAEVIRGGKPYVWDYSGGDWLFNAGGEWRELPRTDDEFLRAHPAIDG